MSTDTLFLGNHNRIPSGLARFGLGDWEMRYGNHRAVVRVTQAADAVCAYLPWRRRDPHPETKHVLVVGGRTGEVVSNSVVVSCNREYGEVVFQPTSGAGTYYLYCLVPVDDENTFKWPRWAFPITQYVPPQDTAAEDWLDRHGLRFDQLESIPLISAPTQTDPYPAAWRSLPLAELVEFQARSAWDSFYPMEVIATLDERLDLERRCRYRPFILFPEKRTNPIRMTESLPYCWAVREEGELDALADSVLRNEYYVFQVGVYASKGPLLNLDATCTELRSAEGATIPASAITCFNLEGVDQHGRAFAKQVHVERGRVQPLWFGVDLPADVAPGTYEGTVTVGANGREEQSVRLALTVQSEGLADRGDGDHWRLSRLRWLNSRIAVDEEVCAPFIPVEVDGSTIHILGRSIALGADGLPVQATSHMDMFDLVEQGRSILAAAVRLEAVVGDGIVSWVGEGARCVQANPGVARFAAGARVDGLRLRTELDAEMDGYLGYRVWLEADRDVCLDTLRLQMPLRPDVARYELYPGETLARACPASFQDSLANFDLLWIGDYNAGLAVRLGENRLPWENEGRGRLRHARSEAAHTITLETGPVTLSAGASQSFDFELYITPFKPLPKAHWDWRYYHAAYGQNLDINAGVQTGARVFTLHHASTTNPYISYPFLVADGLQELAERIHAAGGLFKAYYTIRELSTRAPELWALRSLDTEILEPALGDLGYEELAQLPLEVQLRDPWGHPLTGQPWMCEHLVSNYHTRWHAVIETDPPIYDSSLQISGASRWANFYMEGLRWLMDHAGMDGLYLDGLTFDREAFKRVRKVLVRQKPQGLIDYHSGPTSLPQLPYFDSLWFGEGADYTREPEYWLVGVSGIPFGVPGELLLPDASVQRGMVYGLCQRYGWMSLEQVDPSALWKWWDEFGMREAEMRGYWMPDCPVRVDAEGLRATAYVRKGERTAIAVSSWAAEPVVARLTVDWDALGLDPATARVSIPEIPMFQPALADGLLEALPVEPGKGWIVVVAGPEK